MHQILEVLKPIIEDLHKTLGPNTEVVLHDLRHPQNSIVAISGDISERKVGGPITDFVLRLLQQNQTGKNHINYSNTTSDGKLIRSSTLFINDINGKPIGCLCIHFDLTYILPYQYWLENYCKVNNSKEIFEKSVETFAKNIEEIIQNSINTILGKMGKPIALMTKNDRIKLIQLLNEQGIFIFKIRWFIQQKSLGYPGHLYTITLIKQETKDHTLTIQVKLINR